MRRKFFKEREPRAEHLAMAADGARQIFERLNAAAAHGAAAPPVQRLGILTGENVLKHLPQHDYAG